MKVDYISFGVLFCFVNLVCSCQQATVVEDGVFSESAVEVSFANNKIYSRVIDDMWEDGDAIGVFMYKHSESPSMSTLLSSQDGQKYTNDNSSDTFVPATDNDRLYYPTEYSVDFIAYYPYATVSDLSLSWDISRQQAPSSLDLLYSNNLKDISATEDPLSLSFSHQLSKLTFQINGGDDVTEEELENLVVYIDDLPILSSFNLLTGEFSIEETSRDRLHAYVNGELAQILVYPDDCEGKEVSVVTTSQTYVFRIASPSKWEKGYHYSYSVTLDKYGNSVDLSAEIVPWEDQEGALDEDATQYPVSWDGSQSDIQWYNENVETFELSTPAELCGLSQLVSAGNTFEGKKIMLTRDMNLNGYSFPAIGADMSHAFCGEFDAQGHTISGINIDPENTTSYIALFGVNSGTIRNLTTMGDMQIKRTHERTYAAGIVAYNMGKVEYCNNYVHLSVEVNGESKTTYMYVGGLVGSNSGTVSNSQNRGRIVGNHENEDNAANTYVGGVVGLMIDSKVLECINYQSVDVSGGYVCVGGVCGYMAGQEIKDTPTSILENCRNYGDITSTGFSTLVSAGGIVGNSALCSSKLCGSSNYANVQATANRSDKIAASGGVIGSATHCYLANNANMGLVISLNESDEEKAYGGGLVGMLNASSEIHTSIQQSQANVQASGACGGLVGFLDLTSQTPGVVYGCNTNKGNPAKWIGSASGTNVQSGVNMTTHSEE